MKNRHTDYFDYFAGGGAVHRSCACNNADQALVFGRLCPDGSRLYTAELRRRKRRLSSTGCIRDCLNGFDGWRTWRGRRSMGRDRHAYRAWSPCESGVVAVQVWRGRRAIGRGRRATGVVAVQVWAWSPCFALNCESADAVISAVRE